MKIQTLVKTLGVLVLFISGLAFGQTQVPNTFQAGQPARAAEVNANFSTLATVADQNASAIGTNSQSLTNLSQTVSVNSQDIGTVSQAVADLTPPPGFAFAGFSTVTVNGGAGLFGMNAACQDEFGANSRMALSVEILNSTIQPTLASQTAWVKPVFAAVTRRGDLGASATDVTGFTTSFVWGNGGATGSLSCNGWNNNSNLVRGLAINGNGGFLEQGCGTQAAVACSIAQ